MLKIFASSRWRKQNENSELCIVLVKELLCGGETFFSRGVLRATRCKVEDNAKNGDSSVEKLFTFEESSFAYIKFQVPEPSALSEVSIKSVVTLNAPITDAADYLEPII